MSLSTPATIADWQYQMQGVTIQMTNVASWLDCNCDGHSAS